MLHGQVAGDQRGPTEVARGADGRGHRAVDAVQPSVRQHGQLFAALQVEGIHGAHAHGVCREQARAFGSKFQHAANVSALEAVGAGFFAGIHRSDAFRGGFLHPLPCVGERQVVGVRGRRTVLRAQRALHALREIGGLHADEHRGSGVGVARFQGIDHNLQHAGILACTSPLRRALRHGISTEAHDDLRVQAVVGRNAARLEHAVVVADHQRVVEGPQPRERVGEHGDGEGAREGQHALRLLVRGAGAFARQKQHAVGQQLAGKLRRRNAFHAPVHVRNANGKQRLAGGFCPGGFASRSGVGAGDAGIEQVGQRHVGLERLIEREVQVHRTAEAGSGKALGCAGSRSRGCRRGVLRRLVLRELARPERGDARLTSSLAGEAQRAFIICGQGHTAIGAHVRAVSVRLVAGLRSA